LPVSLYDASVPVFRRYLHNLRAMLALAEARPDCAQLLEQRLAPNMAALGVQAEIVCNFVIRCCAPLTGGLLRNSGHYPPGYAGLRERIDGLLLYLDSLTPHDFDGADERIIVDRAGEADVTLPGQQFLFEYGLPNFFFHLSTAYAILRQAGLPIGKSNFDGFHVYPAVQPA
jgi:hypothetical protein